MEKLYKVRLLVVPENMEEEHHAAIWSAGEYPPVKALKGQDIPYRIDGMDWSQSNPYVDIWFDDQGNANKFRIDATHHGFNREIRGVEE